MANSYYNQSWIGRDVEVISSPDSSLVGRKGLVIDESRETITLLENNRQVVLGKASINFNIDGTDSIIEGSLVRQRAEDRIYRKYRSE